MLNAKLFGRIRVKAAQITFFLLILYCFFINPIEVAPLTTIGGISGSVIALLGVMIRALSAGYISKNDFLASQGLYALSRNPLYLGSFVIVVGLNIVIWNLLVFVVTMAIYAITHIPTILKEEASLAQAFPEQWPAFKEGTPRFFPAIWRLSAYGDISWDLAKWRHNREYRALLAVVLMLVLLALYSGTFHF